jgi:hypothetical protein
MFSSKDAPAELLKIIDKVWGSSSISSRSSKRKDSSATLQHKLWMFDVNKPHSLLEGNTLLNLASR